mmetsp:Transcript_7924/g.48943  ORF Transcript_7924/g.48943 Transcript_7924/m.48943 type:complete len:222 (-) Transcript_7924:903-1568(-)
MLVGSTMQRTTHHARSCSGGDRPHPQSCLHELVCPADRCKVGRHGLVQVIWLLYISKPDLLARIPDFLPCAASIFGLFDRRFMRVPNSKSVHRSMQCTSLHVCVDEHLENLLQLWKILNIEMLLMVAKRTTSSLAQSYHELLCKPVFLLVQSQSYTQGQSGVARDGAARRFRHLVARRTGPDPTLPRLCTGRKGPRLPMDRLMCRRPHPRGVGSRKLPALP